MTNGWTRIDGTQENIERISYNNTQGTFIGNGEYLGRYIKVAPRYEDDGTIIRNSITQNPKIEVMNSDKMLEYWELDGGEYHYVSGDIYVGEYSRGVKHGYGKYYSRNGTIYEGQFSEGTKNGLGIEKWNFGKNQGYTVHGLHKNFGLITKIRESWE
jgi:hypothetical protein